jgi:dipeptidyl aminopeptidase/acylaminoacyl peptidase
MKRKDKKPFNRGRFFRLALVAVVAAVIFGYVGLSLYAAVNYTTSPNRTLGSDRPSDYGLNYEEVAFPSAASDKLTIRGWWLSNPKTPRTLILVHGQNGTRVDQLLISKPLWDNGFNLLLIDMRGHGLSDGQYHTLGLYEQWDVVGAARFLESKGIKPDDIGVMGWSMGAASIIMALGDTSEIKAGVSDSGYANVKALYGSLYPGMSLFTRLIRGIDLDQIRPEDSITRLGNRHIFIIHGDQDGNVPVQDAYRLKDAGGASVSEFWIVPGAAHTRSFATQPEEYLRRVTAFFNKELA